MGEQRDPAAAAPKATDWQDEHTDALDDLDRVAMLRGLRRLDAMRRALGRDANESLPLTEPEPLAPDLGDDYRIERLLGIGGMGAVWLARWRQDDVERDVAVKVLLAGRDSTVAAQRFQRERRILARLQHPGIARLLDVGSTTDGRLFLSMEYIAGHLLQEHVRQHRPDIATRLRLLVEIADAVGFAHRHFVVHRDLKPLNVVVDGDGHAHLLDFGIARLLGDSDEETLTRTGVRFRSAFKSLSLLPIITPPFVIGLAIILLFGLSGNVTQFIAAQLGLEPTRWVYGFTGVLIALVFPAFSPFSGGEYSIIGFIVIVLGGLGNPIGALIAGVFFGIAEQMATVFLPQALAQIVGFALLVATVLVRPTGLFGFRALR